MEKVKAEKKSYDKDEKLVISLERYDTLREQILFYKNESVSKKEIETELAKALKEVEAYRDEYIYQHARAERWFDDDGEIHSWHEHSTRKFSTTINLSSEEIVAIINNQWNAHQYPEDCEVE